MSPESEYTTTLYYIYWTDSNWVCPLCPVTFINTYKHTFRGRCCLNPGEAKTENRNSTIKAFIVYRQGTN